MNYEQFLANAECALNDCREMKETLSAVQAALSAVPDMVRKNERLEKENAEMKATLAAGSHDGRMKLPLDADGEPIRLKDRVWYVGIDAEIIKDDPQQVVGFVSDLGMNGIYAVTRDYPDKAISPKMLTHRAPDPPDSWEKLEEDVNLGCRDYCEKHRLEECDYNMRVHMLDRAKKLAGIEEAER